MKPRSRNFLLPAILFLAPLGAFAQEPIFSWETGLEGWVGANGNPDVTGDESSVAVSTIGATHGINSLAISCPPGVPGGWNGMYYANPASVGLSSVQLQSIFTNATELKLDVSYPNPGYTSWFGNGSVQIFIQGQHVDWIGLGSRSVTIDGGSQTLTFPLSVAQAEGMATSNWGQIILNVTYGNDPDASPPNAVFYIDNFTNTVVNDPPPSIERYWKGDVDNSWAALNWTTDKAGTVPGGALPTDGSLGVAFAADGATNLSTVLGASQNVKSLLLLDGVGAVGIGGTHDLTIGASGVWMENAAGSLAIDTTGKVILGANQVWRNRSTSPMTVSSEVTGAGSLKKSGAGALHLNHANTHTGGTIVEQGTLVLGDVNAMGPDSTIVELTGGVIDLNGLSPTVGGISGAFGTAIHNTTSTPCVLTVDASADSEFGSAINNGPGGGAVSVVKTGSGELTSNAGGNFTGSLVIDDGTFVANGANYGAANSSSLGAGQDPDRQIVVNYPGELSLTTLYVLGNGNTDTSKLPEIVLNQSTMRSSRFNVIGDITLDEAILEQDSTDSGTNVGYQFAGRIKVTGGFTSMIGSTGKGNHLAENTVFDVEEVTGDDFEDLYVYAPLIDRSNDFGASAPGGLTKTGAGMMMIISECAYTGATTVEEGVLMLTVPYLHDTSTVTIASEGILDLAFEEADTVGGLVLGGVIQTETGTYGAPGSGADFETPLISGTGLLFLDPFTPPAGGYADWASVNVGGLDPSEDSNNDGVDNGIAYFMNDTGIIVLPGIDGSNKITWPNGGNIASDKYGTEFRVQTSADLGTWTDVESGDPNLENVEGHVSYTLPAGSGKLFVRLVVAPE